MAPAADASFRVPAANARFRIPAADARSPLLLDTRFRVLAIGCTS